MKVQSIGVTARKYGFEHLREGCYMQHYTVSQEFYVL